MDLRARAFHIMDPKGMVDMLGIFLEERGNGEFFPPSIDISKVSCFPEEALCAREHRKDL